MQSDFRKVFAAGARWVLEFFRHSWSVFALMAGVVLINGNAFPAFGTLFVLRGPEAIPYQTYQTMGLGRVGLAVVLMLVGIYGVRSMIHGIAARRAAVLDARRATDA